MSCGCNNSIRVPVSTCCETPADESITPTGEWLKDKFYEKSVSDFTVPNVGSIGTLGVNNPSRFAVGQYVGIIIGKSKYAYFRVMETGQNTIKILNGCEKGNSQSEIFGNPTPGTVIPEDSIIFPAPPTGCSTQFQKDFANLLALYGIDGVLKLLNESDEIRFFSTPELADDETAFLFGGTTETCDCAPEDSGLVISLLRKIRKVFTGQSGKTICMPEASIIDESDVTVGDVVKEKRVAYFDEKGCLKKGAKAKEVYDGLHKQQVKLSLVYNGNTTPVTINTTTLGIAKQIGSRQRYAVFEVFLIITGPARCQIDCVIDGNQIVKAYTGRDSGGAAEISRQWEIPVTDNQNITLLGRILLGSPETATCQIRLLHFLV